jgi:hypothetical protein
VVLVRGQLMRTRRTRWSASVLRQLGRTVRPIASSHAAGESGIASGDGSCDHRRSASARRRLPSHASAVWHAVLDTGARRPAPRRRGLLSGPYRRVLRSGGRGRMTLPRTPSARG